MFSGQIIKQSFLTKSFTVGTYEEQRAKLYKIDCTRIEINGSVIESEEEDGQGDRKDISDSTPALFLHFYFVQTEDGSIPSTFYPRNASTEIVNIIKAIESAFQANFKGTKVKEEADPQSLHKAKYT